MNLAAIDGVTGPGRRTVLISGNVEEVTFRLKKKILEIVNGDGSTGSYDLAQAESVKVSLGENEFTVALTSKKEKEDDGTETAGFAESKSTARSTERTERSGEEGKRK